MRNRPVSKGKAARRPDWGGDYYQRRAPINPFVNKQKVEAGTYMMRPTSELLGSKYGHGDISVFGDVPTNMQIRALLADGTTKLDKNRQIQSDEPFFVTGQAYASKQGNIILVEVIPPDGFPGWIQLDAESSPGADLANETVKYWFTQSFSKPKARKTRR